MTGRNRKDDIFDFCYDLGLLWSRMPELRFGEIVKYLGDHTDRLMYISDPEMMDEIREFLQTGGRKN